MTTSVERDLQFGKGTNRRNKHNNKGTRRHVRDDEQDGVGRGCGQDPHKLRRLVNTALRRGNLALFVQGEDEDNREEE